MSLFGVSFAFFSKLCYKLDFKIANAYIGVFLSNILYDVLYFLFHYSAFPVNYIVNNNSNGIIGS